MDNVGFIKPIVKEMLNKWEFIDDISGGIDSIVKAGSDYLQKGQNETDLSFKVRLSFADYEDNFNHTVNGVNGLIFNQPISYDDVNPKLESFIENGDSLGNHFDLILSNMFNDSLRYGIGYILVDIPPKGESLADKKMPYCTRINPKNIINWKTETINNNTVLSLVVIKEYIEVDVDEFATEIVEHYRVLTRGDYRLYRTQRQGNIVNYDLIDEGLTGLDYIPLFNLNLENGKFMETTPPFYELAKKNISLYSLETDTRWLYHSASVPMLLGTGLDASELKNLTISANTLITSQNPDAKISWLEYKAQALKFGMEMAESYRKQMAQMGLNAINGSVDFTATQSILDNVKTQSKLFTYKRKLEDTAELILMCVSDMMGLDIKNTGEVNINIDMIKGGIDVQEMSVLSNMVANGQISMQTMWDILKRYDKLPSNFDDEVEQYRISQQSMIADTFNNE